LFHMMESIMRIKLRYSYEATASLINAVISFGWDMCIKCPPPNSATFAPECSDIRR